MVKANKLAKRSIEARAESRFATARDQTGSPGNDTHDEPSASRVLRELGSRSEETISFGDLVGAAGARVHGLALLLLALPETLPLLLPSASTFLAVPLMLIALHLVMFGEDSGWSSSLRHLHLRRSVVATTTRYLAPVLEWFEALSRPRWPALARRERLVGAFCLYLSAVLFLPIPLMNAPPAICLAALALGLIQRDGVIIAFGLAGTVVTTAAVIWLLIWAAGAVT